MQTSIASALIATAAVPAAAASLALGWRALRRARLRRAARITGPGIVEGRYVTIGGVEQWLQLRGEDRRNPVLLVVHGGPGSPYSVFTPALREWERHFTVVHWDRRGAGRTLRRGGPPAAADLTFERMVDDGIEVAEFLRQHLGQPKIVLMAGSMGTLVGLPLVQRRPDLFAAYVGTDFYVNMIANDAAGYRDTLERVRAAGNRRAVRRLEAIGGDPARWDVRAWGARMQWSMATDPAHPNGPMRQILSLLLTNPDYTLRDAWAWLSGFARSRDAMFEQFMPFDARAAGTRFEVPFFLFQGAADVVTLTRPAVEYFDDVQAPVKELVLIDGASHFCAFTHPGPFLDALVSHVLPVVAAGSERPARSDRSSYDRSAPAG